MVTQFRDVSAWWPQKKEGISSYSINLFARHSLAAGSYKPPLQIETYQTIQNSSSIRARNSSLPHACFVLISYCNNDDADLQQVLVGYPNNPCSLQAALYKANDVGHTELINYGYIRLGLAADGGCWWWLWRQNEGVVYSGEQNLSAG